MKTPYSIIVSCIVLILSLQAKAGLQVYTPDDNTLHLWHFDDSTNYNSNGQNTVTDAVTTAGITMTNFGLGGPPYTNIFLITNGSMAALADCLSILPSDGSTVVGASHAFCGLGSALANSFPDTTSFRNGTSGAFTFEALIQPTGNIFSSSAGNGEWEVFCGDNNGSGGLARGWQFRLQNGTTPSINFNFITASGGSAINFTTNLPTTGPDALAVGQWYHVAVTYTGNAPTNGDTVGVLTVYWTLLDSNRTNADYLASVTNSAAGTLGGTPNPAIGGSARTQKGVGNAGSFQGYIDEVRVSSIARQSTDMIFITNSSVNPPTFAGGSEPPTNTFIGYGKTLALNTVVKGTLPIYYQWQKTNSSSGGWTNVINQTNNTYLVSSSTFNDAGFYRLIATNAALTANSVTSTVAQVTIGAVPSELFNTGINTNGLLDTSLAGSADPHYMVVRSPDLNNLGPSAIVWNMSTYPIAAYGGAFANPDGVSQWTGSQGNSYISTNGQFIYRTYFVLDSVDVSKPVTISGNWWNNSIGNDILINGISTGSAGVSHSPITPAAFTITNGFKPGLNTLDFVATKDGNTGGGTYQESAVRVEISGLGQALPAGLPVITNQPADQTVVDANTVSGSVATFSVVALGRPPLNYQWYADNNPIADATNRTLAFANPSSSASPGTDFKVVVSNDSGSVTSSVAVLTLVTTNQPPVVPSYTLVIYSNMTATFNLDTAFQAATDADHDTISLGSPAFDATTTNGVTLTQNGVTLTYTPTAGYVGADQFNYYITDSQGATTAGAVNINVLPLAANGISARTSGNNIVVTGAGSPLGTFHLLSSTNLTIPLSNWVVTATGTFDNAGNASITNSTASTNGPQKFYILQVP